MSKDKSLETHRLAALAFMLAAQVFSALMNVATRLLETRRSRLDPLQILSVRMILTAILLTLYLWRSGIPGALLGPKGVRRFLVIRALGGFMGVFGLYYSLAHISLSEATAMLFLTPFCTSALCYMLLGETFTFVDLGACFISFVGVLIVTRPSLSILPEELSSIAWKKLDQEGTIASANRNLALLVGFIGVLSSAGALTAVRRAGIAAHPLTCVNYFVVFSAILSTSALLLVPGQKGFVTSLETQEWGLIFTAGLFGLLMQISMTISLQLDKASRATSMMFTQIIFAVILDKMVFGYDPDIFTLSGISLILLSAMFVGVRVSKAAKDRSPV